MDKKILDLIINIPLSLFLEANLEDDTFNELKGNILYAESNISEELSANLYGKNFIEKEDIIREYIVSIGHMYDQGVKRWPLFDGKNSRHCFFIQGITGQAINGFGRNSDHFSLFQ